MNTVRPRPASAAVSARVLAALRLRLAEVEETLDAIRSGEVDVVMVTRKKGLQLFTLEGAEHSYRVLIESMNEGALTLAGDKTILYANRCFARMVKVPLEQVTGSSFRRFLSAADRATLRPLMKKSAASGSKLLVLLHAGDGSLLPVQISVREMAKDRAGRATIGMVVTDLTEARRNEELLRALAHRVVQVQEAERGRLATELHDNITQLLCGVLFSSQALANKISARAGAAKREAIKLRDLLGKTAEEVERISRNLQPSELAHLGLGAALSALGREFAERSGVAIRLTVGTDTPPLSAEAELALYRILQEALNNVEKHAGARHVAVGLTQPDGVVQLVVSDDGVGLAPDRYPVSRKGKGALGLLSMRERATAVGGTLAIRSARRAGTEIEVRIPVAETKGQG